jgi:hypothetical protein
MAEKFAIAVIHGMGSQKPDFAGPMIKEVTEKILARNKNLSRADLAWAPIYWADILETREKNYLDKSKYMSQIDLIQLRRFVIDGLADAAAYQRVTTDSKRLQTYDRIHERVRQALRDVAVRSPEHGNIKLAVMAHSLGGHIMSDYIYDMQKKVAANHPDVAGLSPLERMETLIAMITFGCNIPIFTFAYDAEDIHPIKFPDSQSVNSAGNRKKWLNLFDPQDILGYPLQPLNDKYDQLVEDKEINVGGLLTSWNPLSHGEYWTDDDFTDRAANHLASLL